MSPLAFSSDCYEFIQKLNLHNVEWVIVGGEAVIYYGYTRLTGEVVFFFRSDEKNVENLWQALYDFWDGQIPGEITKHDLKEPGYFIQFGIPPNRIDLMNKIDGVEFDEVWQNKVTESVETDNENIEIYFIGIDELIKNKTVSGRAKDMEDLNYLKKRKNE